MADLPIILLVSTDRGDLLKVETNDEDDLIESIGENVRDMLGVKDVTRITLQIIR